MITQNVCATILENIPGANFGLLHPGLCLTQRAVFTGMAATMAWVALARPHDRDLCYVVLLGVHSAFGTRGMKPNLDIECKT